MDAFAHCAALLRAEDKDRFLSALFAPADKRPALHALYAFDLETALIGFRVRDPMAGEIRLQWWRDVIAGERAEEAVANPVAAALRTAMSAHALPRGPFDALLDARGFDVHADPMVALAELEGYALQTMGSLIALAARALGAPDDLTMPAAIRHAAIAAVLTDVLRRFPAHASRGQLFVPIEILDRHHAKVEDIFAGRLTLEIQGALADLRLHARKHFSELRDLYPRLPGAARPAFLPAMLAPQALARMERRDYDPFRTAVAVPQWRTQWRLWRMARGNV
jgi:phytoene synthase